MRTLDRLLAATVSLAAALSFYACVGDDPATTIVVGPSSEGGTDAGSDVGPTGPDAGDAASEGGCGDTSTSETSCGACGHACKSGVGCFSGRCGNEIVDLSAGAGSTCAVLANQQAYCWGDNTSLQVGDPGGVNHDKAFHIAQDHEGNAFGDVVQISVGERHACARKTDGTIWCWGSGEYSQLAGQEPTGTAKPIKIPNLKGFKSIAAGGFHTCGGDGTGVVYCWGGNAHGALGHAQGTSGDATCGVPEGTHCNSEPSVIALGGSVNLTAEAIGLGRAHGCALEPLTHMVRCWGLGDEGQLGTGTSDSALPLTVGAAQGATALAIGGRGHACALKGGKLECWGKNTDGEIGTGSTQSPVAPTTAFGALSGVKLGAAGDGAICAYDTTMKCAGFALFGSVGNGALSGNAGADQTMAIAVVGPDGGAPLANVVRAAAGSYHTCVATLDQQIYCWGSNATGQLGNGTSGNANNNPTPSRVLGLP